MLSHSAIAVIARPVSCLLSTADIYDNTRHVGGATVSPVVVRPDGEESNRALVKDLSDGQYLITFTPDEAGEWAIGAMVDGEEISPDHELQVRSNDSVVYDISYAAYTLSNYAAYQSSSITCAYFCGHDMACSWTESTCSLYGVLNSVCSAVACMI